MSDKSTVDDLSATEDENASSESGHGRRYRRRSILWPAKIRVGRHEFQAQLWNVSLGGAKVRLDIPLKEGTEAAVLIPAKGIELAAQVVWHTGDVMGVLFLQSPEKVKEIFEDSAITLGLEATDDRPVKDDA